MGRYAEAARLGDQFLARIGSPLAAPNAWVRLVNVTAEAHRMRIMKKLDAHNAISLFRAARRLGLIA